MNLFGFKIRNTIKSRQKIATYRKVNTGDSIHDDEDISIGKLAEAIVQADGKHEHVELKVKVERTPSGRLMFWNWCDDGDVVLGIRWIQQGVETASPWGDLSSQGQNGANNGCNSYTNDHQTFEQDLEIVCAQSVAQVVNECVDLAQSKNSKGLEWDIEMPLIQRSS